MTHQPAVAHRTSDVEAAHKSQQPLAFRDEHSMHPTFDEQACNFGQRKVGADR